ncbi:MAG TPA: ABC transporter substrate-binding protein [Candidatus Methylomirabilis sp.]|nr:ABC transporter substrate-binding protein [Candidatus Methylomirabilis sp.]
MNRHRASFLVPLLVGAFLTAGHAQDKKPTPTESEGSFVYVAPSFIKELDNKYPVQPPVPPSPPRYGGVLQFPAPAIRTFDPTVGYRPDLALVWDTLTEWEATWYYPEVQRTPVIRKTLVTDWEMKDPSTWIFKLRRGVRFHNRPPVNGREMVAEDVRYSYELLKDKAQYANRAAMVKNIQVLDKYTLRFELKMPDPKFYLNIVDSLSPVVVPREAVEAPGGLAENPIGTGAFMLKEFVPGEGALLVKNPDYYLKDKEGRPLPYVDAVRLLFTKDASTETALFRTRQLDLMRVSTLDLLYALIKTVPDLTLYRVPSLGWGDYGLALAVEKAPFNDARVRQALSMAINRDILAEVINRGDATLYGPFPWVMAGITKRSDYSYANLGPNYQYNPKKARELLAAAGLPNGFDLEIEWAEFQGWTYGDFAQLLSRFFSDIGIRVKLKQLETAAWIAKVQGVQPFSQALATASPIGAGPSFMDWVYLRYHSSLPKTMNREGIKDAKLDDLLVKWQQDPGDKRPAIQKAIWDHLRQEVYRITTIVPPHYRVSQSYVHAGGNPYCWFPGYCTYEAKTAWLTDKAPARKLDRFAQ